MLPTLTTFTTHAVYGRYSRLPGEITVIQIQIFILYHEKTPVATPPLTPHSESEEAGLDIVLEIRFLVTYHVAVLIRHLHLECSFHRLANCHLDSAADVS